MGLSNLAAIASESVAHIQELIRIQAELHKLSDSPGLNESHKETISSLSLTAARLAEKIFLSGLTLYSNLHLEEARQDSEKQQ